MELFSSKKKTKGKASAATPEFPITPHGSLMYGELARACTVMFGNLDADLHKHLLDNTPAFTCAESGMIDLGFAKCIDYPFLPDHVYYEGYFHSCRNSQPIESLNPRNGRPFNKPPAPKALRALYIAFREKNRALLSEMALKILELPQAKPLHELEERQGTQEVDYRKVIADMFSPEGTGEILCGDLAIQVHCGTGVSYEHIGWHHDATNSMFHFATSIKGKRELYSILSDQPDNTKQQIFVDRLKAPNIYISSPAFFMHAVSYPEQSWEDRTIAVQARFLLTAELLGILGMMTKEVKGQVSHIIAETLCRGFSLPSFQEVIEVEETLDDYQGSLKVDENYLDGIKEHFN